MNKNVIRGLVMVGVLVGSQAAHAAIDVGTAVSEIEGIAAPAGLIGLAMLGVLATIKGWKMIRRAM